MNNASYSKRIYPAKSFTIARGIHLLNKSSSRYEQIRKGLPFVLILDKRVLVDVKEKEAISVDTIFSSEKYSPPYNVLKKLPEMMSDKESNVSTLVTLYIDEINIFARYLFRSQKCIFGPVHNERNSLADSMLVFYVNFDWQKTIYESLQ